MRLAWVFLGSLGRRRAATLLSFAAIVLAAGASTRFGGGKLSALLDGEPLIHHAIRAAQAAPAQPAPVVLTLTSHKVLYLNDERVDDLAPALARFERAQPVTVRADGALALTDFVDVVDRVKALGFEKVALEVRRT